MKRFIKENSIWIFILGAIIVGLLILTFTSTRPGELDTFAQCLEEEGAVMYGAFWCPACNSQKQMFGRSHREIPYIECSNPDRNQNELCDAEGIQQYPTWEFADGERLVGVASLEDLAERTSCELPS